MFNFCPLTMGRGTELWVFVIFVSLLNIRKIPASIKSKSAPPPPQNQKYPPSLKTRNFMDMEVFLQKERIFPGAHKIGAATSDPRIADKTFNGHEDFSDNMRHVRFVTNFFGNLAHRNRSDFCDLRLRCPSRTPEIARFPRQETAMLHCDLRVRWKVASDLRFRAAMSEPKTSDLFGTRVRCIPEFGTENKSALFQDFLLLSAASRVRGRFQNPRQTPVHTKLRLKRFPKTPQIFLRDFWRFGFVNAEIASDCDCGDFGLSQISSGSSTSIWGELSIEAQGSPTPSVVAINAVGRR